MVDQLSTTDSGLQSVKQQALEPTLALPEADPGRSSSLHSEDCRVEAQPLPLGRCPLDSELAIFWLRRPLLLSELLVCLPPAGLPGGWALQTDSPAVRQRLNY